VVEHVPEKRKVEGLFPLFEDMLYHMGLVIDWLLNPRRIPRSAMKGSKTRKYSPVLYASLASTCKKKKNKYYIVPATSG